jgi:hypothetical protein
MNKNIEYLKRVDWIYEMSYLNKFKQFKIDIFKCYDNNYVI